MEPWENTDEPPKEFLLSDRVSLQININFDIS